MNNTLINSFKEYCNPKLKSLINSCYILTHSEYKSAKNYPELILICEIYSLATQSQQLVDYKEEILDIADLVGIDIIDIIPIEQIHLATLKQKALETNNPNLFKHYLNLLYLF